MNQEIADEVMRVIKEYFKFYGLPPTAREIEERLPPRLIGKSSLRALLKEFEREKRLISYISGYTANGHTRRWLPLSNISEWR